MHANKNLGNCIIEIFDRNGRKIFEKEVDNPRNYFTLDINGIKPGLYIFKIQADNLLAARKFVVSF